MLQFYGLKKKTVELDNSIKLYVTVHLPMLGGKLGFDYSHEQLKIPFTNPILEL